MNADQLFNAVRDHLSEGGAPHLQIPADWSQGRTVFGGLSAALAFVPPIHIQLLSKVARFAITTDKVTQGRPALRNGCGQHLADDLCQAQIPRFADLASGGLRADTRQKETLVGVDVQSAVFAPDTDRPRGAGRSHCAGRDDLA